MTANNGEVGHANHPGMPLLDQGELANHVEIPGPSLLHFQEEDLVDLKNDLQMPWQYLLEQPDTPFFKGFGEQGVVRVGEGTGDNIPGVFPRKTIDVMKEALEFNHGDGRMGIVELDGNLLGEIVPIHVAPAESSDDILQRAGDKEVLLNEAKFLAAFSLVVGIQDLGDHLAVVFIPDRLVVTAAIEGLEVKILVSL